MTKIRQIKKDQKKQQAHETIDLIMDMAETIRLQDETIEAQRAKINELQK